MRNTRTQSRGWRGGRTTAVVAAACYAVLLAGCDDLLEVELPGQITEEDTFVPGNAQVLVNSAIADIECGLSDFIASNGAGSDDVASRSVGWWGSVYEFGTSPGGANCSIAETSYGWFTPLHKGRWMAEQVYNRIASEWDPAEVPNREQLMATAAIYAGIVYTHLGEYFCEVTADTGPLMSWQQSLSKGEEWFTTALNHIASTGDFAIPTGVTSSAEQMALLLRARARFARGESALADADAVQIQQGFTSYITREGGGERTRWNRVFSAFVGQPGWVPILGPIDWWTGTDPVSGDPWPAVIPFTGYWNLGVLPDGRAVSDAGYPITTDAEPTAVADGRVETVFMNNVAGPNDYPLWRQDKYKSLEDDYPLAKWQEAWLIRAQVAFENAEYGTAISLVNDVRAAYGLPDVTYIDATATADQVRTMLIEEIRRTHFLEGRYWSTKLRYDLWFPRGEGSDQFSHNYNQGVRLVMPGGEFDLNPNLTEEDRGSLCPPFEDPTT